MNASGRSEPTPPATLSKGNSESKEKRMQYLELAGRYKLTLYLRHSPKGGCSLWNATLVVEKNYNESTIEVINAIYRAVSWHSKSLFRLRHRYLASTGY